MCKDACFIGRLIASSYILLIPPIFLYILLLYIYIYIYIYSTLYYFVENSKQNRSNKILIRNLNSDSHSYIGRYLRVQISCIWKTTHPCTGCTQRFGSFNSKKIEWPKIVRTQLQERIPFMQRGNTPVGLKRNTSMFVKETHFFLRFYYMFVSLLNFLNGVFLDFYFTHYFFFFFNHYFFLYFKHLII